MIIRNDASNLFFFAYLTACLPAGMDDRCSRNASVNHILIRFLPFTGAMADIHINLKTKIRNP
jgi:hypothetical protein